MRVGWPVARWNSEACSTVSLGRVRTTKPAYEAYHELSLIDSKGRLSQRRLSRGPRTIRVQVSGRMNDPAAEGDGSQTTTLAATVTLKRLH